MKKIIISLILALPFLMFVSCSGEADSIEPDTTLTVDHTVEVSGVTLLNGTFYTIAGMVVTIDGVSIHTVNDEADAPTLQGTTYFLNDNMISSPKNRKKESAFVAPEGSYKLNAAVALRRPDNSLTGMSVTIPLIVVKNASMLPADAPAIGTYSTTIRVRK